MLVYLQCFCTLAASAQYNQSARNAFLNQSIQQAFDYWNISSPSTKFHSSFRPYLSSTFSHASDSGIPFRIYPFNNMFFSKTLNESPQKRNWFNLQLHPVLDAEGGYDALLQRPLSSITGGAHFKLNINDDFTFAATLVGGNIQLPFFNDTVLKSRYRLPEFGQAYLSHNNAGYNFFDWQGYISYSPLNNKRFNFQLGRDKHFIGDGYRSLLLSDFAPAYPYFRINAKVWRIQYNVWYSWMADVSRSTGLKRDFTNKFGAFHYLSFNILKELNVSLFENVIWRGSDTSQARSFDINYLNPVIFFRPVEYSLGSSDNSFMGANVNTTLFNKVKVYAQLAMDEFFLKEIRLRRGWWANKQGWQFGAKYINAFGIKGLRLQAEYNEVRPYTYSHGLPEQNYAHSGFALAHPLGANFREFIGMVSHRRNRLELSAQGMYALIGKDSASAFSNVGQNIFASYVTRPFEYGHYTTQGEKTTLLQGQLKVTFHMLPAMNMRIELSMVQRAQESVTGYILQNPYFNVAFRTSFWNSYRDF